MLWHKVSFELQWVRRWKADDDLSWDNPQLLSKYHMRHTTGGMYVVASQRCILYQQLLGWRGRINYMRLITDYWFTPGPKFILCGAEIDAECRSLWCHQELWSRTFLCGWRDGLICPAHLRCPASCLLRFVSEKYVQPVHDSLLFAVLKALRQLYRISIHPIRDSFNPRHTTGWLCM